MYGKKIADVRGMVSSLYNTVSRNDKVVWDDRVRTDKRFENLSDSLVYAQKRIAELEETTKNLLRIVEVSGIIEVAETGKNLFQFHNTTDLLQRYPLYKINKVVTKCRA